MTIADPSWLVRLGPVRDHTVRLVCLPQAGGGSSTFRPLAGALPSWVDVQAVRLPGRETRRREPPLTDLDAVVDVLHDELVGSDRPVALLGYCSGALLAHELATRLAGNDRLGPVFACASQAPHDYGRNVGVHTMDRVVLLDYLRGMNVMPESILGNADLFTVFEPAIRADFALFETTAYRPAPQLDVPVVAIGDRDDPGVTFADLLEWRQQAGGVFAVHEFVGGGHGLLTSSPQLLASVLTAFLSPYLPRSGS